MNRLYWVSLNACNITTWDGAIFFEDETQKVEDLGVRCYGFNDYNEYRNAYNASDYSYHASLIDYFHSKHGRITYSPRKTIHLCHQDIIRLKLVGDRFSARSELSREYCESFDNYSNDKFIFPKLSDIMSTLWYERVIPHLWYCLDWKG